MNKTDCRYYNPKKDSCPFDYGCDEDCYFSYKKKCDELENCEELRKEFEDYQDEKEDEIDDLESENEDLQFTIQNLEDRITDLEQQQEADYQDTDLYKKQNEKINRLQKYCADLQKEIIRLKSKEGAAIK